MVRVITQETYDEVVKENIDEFEMSPEEAIKEAVAQFSAQGVDLSNIIKDLYLGSGDNHLVTKTVTNLKELSSDVNYDENKIIKELSILQDECYKDIAHRVRAGKEGAYDVLIMLLEKKINDYTKNKHQNTEYFLIRILEAMYTLMDVQPDLLEQKGIKIIKNIFDNIENEEILQATLKWGSVCCLKHEMNRQRLFGQKITQKLKSFLKHKNSKLLSATLQLTRRLTLDDDIRLEFGKAHEHATELGTQMLESLTKLLKENTKPPLVSELMLTIASLLVRNELCAIVSDAGVDVLFTILADNYDNAAVIQQADKLITALAGNDDVKRALVSSGIASVLVPLLSRHSNNAATTALSLKCVAALTLRETKHSQLFFDNGVTEAIVECMKLHPNDCSVQKNACWAIRNMVARSREQNAKYHELGVEVYLNVALEKFNKEIGFDVKSALRDLECDVKLDEQWTGKGSEIDQ